MGLFMGIPRISDPTPYEWPLCKGSDGPNVWSFTRVTPFVDEEAEFKLEFFKKGGLPVSTLGVAMALSLRKWEILEEAVSRLIGWLGPSGWAYVNDGGWKSCALCVLYAETRCEGCPIFEETGLVLCTGTPYEDTSDGDHNDLVDLYKCVRAERVWLHRLRRKHGIALEVPWPTS